MAKTFPLLCSAVLYTLFLPADAIAFVPSYAADKTAEKKDPPPSSSSSPSPSQQGRPASPMIPTNRISLSHAEGGGMGYSSGFTSLGLFLGPNSTEDTKYQPFVDGRGHYFTNKDGALNLGVGGRMISYGLAKVFGLNLYYDYYNAHNHGFNQLGLGFEMLSCILDLRVNGYLPLGDKNRKGTDHVFTYPGGFVATCQIFHTAFNGGMDADVSTSLRNFYPFLPIDLSVGAAPYFYHNKHGPNVRGGNFHAGFQYLDNLSLDCLVSHDNVFGTIVQGVFSLTFYFGNKESYSYNGSCDGYYLREKSVRPVFRNPIIATKKRCCRGGNF